MVKIRGIKAYRRGIRYSMVFIACKAAKDVAKDEHKELVLGFFARQRPYGAMDAFQLAHK